MAPIRPNPTLSDDLISEILVRVPVKSLLQFQLVSKTWLSLIKDPGFVKAQLRRAIATETDQTLIMTSETYLTDTENATLQFSVFDVDSREIVADLKYPYTQGESQQVDPVDDDYKIVSVVSGPSLPTEVYSANRNVWRKVPDEDYKIVMSGIDFLGNFNVCVNGLLFGVKKDALMVFDLNTEVLNCAIKLPRDVAAAIAAARAVTAAAVGGLNIVNSYEAHPKTRIIEYNKSVAVIMLWANALNDDRTGKGFNKAINMWKLEDDTCLRGGGVEASWTLMFSIDLAMPTELFNGYFSNGDLLLLIGYEDYRWISCNARKKEARIARVYILEDHRYTRYLYRYTESLVSLAGFKQISWNRGYGDD